MPGKLAIALAVAAVAATARPAVAADAHGNQLLYNYAMRCFVAGAVLGSQLRHHGGSQLDIDAADRGSRSAYDYAFRAGEALGYTKQRVSGDLDAVQRSEQRRLILESGYMDATRADCVKLDFMPAPSE